MSRVIVITGASEGIGALLAKSANLVRRYYQDVPAFEDELFLRAK